MLPESGARRTNECVCAPKLHFSPKGKGCWLPGSFQSLSGGSRNSGFVVRPLSLEVNMSLNYWGWHLLLPCNPWLDFRTQVELSWNTAAPHMEGGGAC